MKQRISGLDIWYKHVYSVIFKGLYMLQESSHVQDIRSCVIWQYEDENRQGPIGCTLLQVDDDRSYGVRDFLGSPCNAHGREYPFAVGADAGAVGSEERWDNTVVRL